MPDVDWGSAFHGTGEAYRPDDAPGFGDQLSHGGPGSFPVGPYASVLSGNPLRFCVDDCRTHGPIDLAKLSDDLEGVWIALTKCDYTGGPAVLTFTIDAAGHVGHIDTDGAGAKCAAEVIASNQFRATTGPTDITLSLGYK